MFKAGDKVVCKRHVNFCDHTFHSKGIVHTIKDEEVAYYNFNSKDYELLPKDCVDYLQRKSGGFK